MLTFIYDCIIVYFRRNVQMNALMCSYHRLCISFTTYIPTKNYDSEKAFPALCRHLDKNVYIVTNNF